jgi:flagellar FliL protein
MAKAAKAKEEEIEAAPEGAEGAEPKKKFSLKMIIIAVAGLVVVGGGGGAYFFMSKGHHDDHPPAPVVKPVVFMDLPEVLVNLSSAQGDRTQYLKVKMTLEVADQQLQAQIQPMMPRVMDTFQTYLRELRPSDLDGSAGLYRLKEELTRRVNATITPNRVNALLFKEIVVQ